MSADRMGTCPDCGQDETVACYEGFYIEDGKMHAEFDWECKESWGGCGFTCGGDFEPIEISELS